LSLAILLFLEEILMLYRFALVFLLFTLLLMPNNITAQSAEKLPPIKVKEYKLDNGLRVIFHQDR